MRTRTGRTTTAVLAGLASMLPAVLVADSVDAAAPPAGTLVRVVETAQPVDLAWRTGDDALYVVGQGGTILQLVGDATTPVLDISGLTSGSGEQGLLGLAFAPDGAHAYINFTDNNGDTVVAELAVSADGLAFDRDNMRTVLTIDQPYANHNGGDLAFGPDGMLYIGTGDGGSGGDPERRAQHLDSLLGKMLRIDPTPSGDLGYTIPADNPLVGVEGARGEIWSLGLRNPWRFSFDPDTGDLWIADVGQGSIEEIDVAPATAGVDAAKGTNFGWSAYEGDDVFNTDQVDAVAEHHAPIHTYSHDGGACSVSGGVRARGAGAGAFAGWYLFADYCTGEGAEIAAGDVVTVAQTAGVTAVVSGPDGTVYVLDNAGVNALQPA